jgi:hypothetical protein
VQLPQALKAAEYAQLQLIASEDFQKAIAALRAEGEEKEPAFEVQEQTA